MTVIRTRRWWALGALVLSALTIGFDATILNVALPTLAVKIDASNAELQWIVDAYILIFAGLLLPAGVLADRVGRRAALVLGLGLFGVASGTAMTAGDPHQLILARALMGVGAAIITPTAMAVIPTVFAPHERARAVALTTVALGLGVPLGPLVGGYLIEHFWWGSVFAVNIPMAAVALIAVAALIPESKDPEPARLDVIGAALSTVGLVLFVYGIIAGPDRGWRDSRVLGAITVGLVLLVAFVRWQRRRTDPMIDLGLFGDRQFRWATIAATIASFAMFGLLFVLPQFLQVVAGNDAFGTGLRLIPMMLGLVVGARLGEALLPRVGARGAIAGGLAAIGLALATAAVVTTADTSYGVIAAWLAATGFGVGLSMAPAMTAVLEVIPSARAGMGTSLAQTMRQVGGALGVAALGSVLASAYTQRLTVPTTAAALAAARESVAAAQVVAGQTGHPAIFTAARIAYAGAMDRVLLICGLVALVGAVLVGWRMPASAGRIGAVTDAGRESTHEPAGTA